MLRTQYHFRPSSKGLLAWDIRRLISLSKDLPVTQIDIAALVEVDEDHWYAIGRIVPTCRSVVEHCALINDADLSYPIILDQSGRVMDGMHRVCKAMLLGFERVDAVRFCKDPEPDYIDRHPDTLP